MRHILRVSVLAVLLAGCTTFPELDAVVSEEARRADYPNLVPAEHLLAKRTAWRLSETTGEMLLARAARLKARARILRGISSVDEDTRLRIGSQLRRLGG
jgi:hypothetical protein